MNAESIEQLDRRKTVSSASVLYFNAERRKTYTAPRAFAPLEIIPSYPTRPAPQAHVTSRPAVRRWAIVAGLVVGGSIMAVNTSKPPMEITRSPAGVASPDQAQYKWSGYYRVAPSAVSH